MKKSSTSLLLLLAKPIAVLAVTVGSTVVFVLLLSQPKNPPSHSTPPSRSRDSMARSFVLWLHGLGDSGPANEPIKTLFTSPEFRNTRWSFPSAPSQPVTCNRQRKERVIQFRITSCSGLPADKISEIDQPAGLVWLFFSIEKESARYRRIDRAVMPSWFDLHEIPITAVSPNDENGVLKAVRNVHNIIDKEITAGTNPDNIFSFCMLVLIPAGGGAVFSGWVPFNSSIIEQIPPDAKKTPILWSHGMDDRTVFFEAGQAGPPFLERAAPEEIDVYLAMNPQAYPGLGHSISTDELRYLETWIKARLRSSS
ncbi:hypothetical protein RHSIM_Rhsim13G0147900 [Rhododendron simsii]|uniref:Phospholipase/carboxylesterase/thioesterase domain-containing protein n=1 Tax=Rhododendron simsii TaxID=118357 RepID=A0A834FY05_RHOSS|nr:hypothetical protein RHSIM_Rhsim13G0147900 [Rhododendron simsii]